MKSKPEFDPDWPASSPWRLWPFRSIRQLMMIVGASGLFLALTVTIARQPLSSIILWDPGLSTSSTVRPRLALFHAPDEEPQPLVFACPAEAPPPVKIQVQPHDPMIVIAPESINPGMVVRAPAWIDPNMVFTPRGRERQPEQGGLPAPAPRVPGIDPQVGPQYKRVPIPDGSSPRGKGRRGSRDPTQRR